jgi:hypothetical protein
MMDDGDSPKAQDTQGQDSSILVEASQESSVAMKSAEDKNEKSGSMDPPRDSLDIDIGTDIGVDIGTDNIGTDIGTDNIETDNIGTDNIETDVGIETETEAMETADSPPMEPMFSPPSVASIVQQQQQQQHPLSNPMAKMQSLLAESLTDFQVRSEVGDCLNSLLVDVEIAHNLGQQLQVRSHQSKVERLTREQKATIQETKAQTIAREDHRLQLADQLVQEMMSHSREFELLLVWKQEQQHKVQNYDEMMARLAQAEEELQAANRVSYGGGVPVPARTPAVPPHPVKHKITAAVLGPQPLSPAKEETKVEEEVAPSSPAKDETKVEKVQNQENPDKKHNEDPAVGTETMTKPSSDDPIEEEKKLPAETIDEIPSYAETVVDIPPDIDTTVAIPGPADEGESKDEDIKEVVVFLDEDPDEEIPGLLNIDVEILMTIFGFLDAIDILNTAQINIPMYSRVDAIFGIAGDGHAPPAPTQKTPAKPTTVSAPASQKIAPHPQYSPTSYPATTPKNNIDTKPAAVSPPVDSAASSMGKGLFAMLQPRLANAAPVKSGVGAAGRRQEGVKNQPLNAAVAQSMAAKLSDSELAAIISMTEKLGKMEKEVFILRNEKEEMQAKLDGTEAVKQFLIGKVRDVEMKLAQSNEVEVKVTQQIASDQEVIAFLDGRVQELERLSETLQKENNASQAELKQLKHSSGQKVTVLGDMLKYEREKLRENESDWKATKKVLVKEIKSCRSQILALQAERDGFKEQNERLKRAITSTGKNSGSSKR